MSSFRSFSAPMGRWARPRARRPEHGDHDLRGGARNPFGPFGSPGLVGGRVEDARRHIEGCSACRDFVAQDHMLVDAYEQSQHAKAPIELRERIYAAIARERALAGPATEATGGGRPDADSPTPVAAAADRHGGES